jgi:glycosyltransferase involved in cell wall biosynthesis
LTDPGTAALRAPDPLRVLHVRASDRHGGPERLILAQCLRAAPDVSPCIASFEVAGTSPAFLAVARRLGVSTLGLPQRGPYDRSVARFLRERLEEARPDLVVGHDYKADWVLHRSARPLGIPRVAVVHGYTAEDWKVRLFESLDRRILRTVDAVVVVSEAQRERLARSRIPSDRLHVVENAVDVDAVARTAAAGRAGERARLGAREDDLLVLSVGRLSPEKGHAHLLEAFATAFPPSGPPARLVLVGDGPERAGLEARAARPDLAARVHFEGWRDDPHVALGAADLFVLPSLREGLPLALLEAMAAGVAAIATNVGGVPAAAHGVALLTPPADAPALAGALASLASDPKRRGELARAARERVRADYDADRQVRRLEGLYRLVARR